MSSIEIKVMPAELADEPGVMGLLNEAGLPLAGVHEHLAGFVVARRAGQIVGVAGLEAYGDQGLLRSVVVAPDQRETGLGRRLVEAVLAAARQRRLRSLTLLTETAAAYFPRFGFRPVARAEVAGALASSEEFRGACPESAVALRLDLAEAAEATDHE